MTYRTPNPVFRRNLFLIGAGILLILAILTSPSVLLCLVSSKGLAGAALVVGAGLFAAMGIREFAEALLRGPGNPWYVRPGALFFLLIVLICVNALASLVCNLAFGLLRLSHIIPQRALIFEFMAMGFLWIAILDWPARHERPYRDAGSSQEPPSAKPHFRHLTINLERTNLINPNTRSSNYGTTTRKSACQRIPCGENKVSDLAQSGGAGRPDGHSIVRQDTEKFQRFQDGRLEQHGDESVSLRDPRHDSSAPESI